MKRRWTTIVFLVVIGALASLYFGCANPQNPNNANPVAIASPEPTPDKAAIEAELTRIENDWPRILKERDAAAVKRIEADDIILVYPDGASGTKDQDLKDIEAGSLSAESWEISDLTVNVLDNDAAVVRLRTAVKNGKYKLPDGRSQDISGQYRSVDTFVRRNGQWLLVASATVPVKNPEPSTTTSPTPKASPSTKPSPAAKASPAVKSSPAAKTSPAVKPSPKALPVRTSTP